MIETLTTGGVEFERRCVSGPPSLDTMELL